MSKTVSALHGATHQLPGVPAHHDATANQRSHHLGGSHPNNRQPNVRNSNRPHRHHQAPPRVLVAWQNWIGRLVGRSDR
jgi:hypothetical protein